MHLLPLLMREVQKRVCGLPAVSWVRYGDVRALPHGPAGCVRSVCLCSAAAQCDDLVAEARGRQGRGLGRGKGQVVLEQFVAGLPSRTVFWVQCHRRRIIWPSTHGARQHRGGHRELSSPPRHWRGFSSSPSPPFLQPFPSCRTNFTLVVSFPSHFHVGAVGGLATFTVSAPSWRSAR